MATTMTIDVLPLRVIDIPATLATTGGIRLSKPMQWDFHILSHTWSADIRNLSKKIGKLLKKLPMDGGITDCGAAVYNGAFENANFKDDPESSEAYEHLRELLLVIMTDGVQKLWFDALCIDQTSSDEKSREISRMAEYYSNSQGCYVLTFGFGRGYRLWSDIKETMPRWFQRVWTLQEFLLPKKLTFLVEALDSRLIQMVEDLSSTLWNSHLGFCKCGVPSDLLEFDPPSIREFRYREKPPCPANSKDMIDSVDGVCPKCKRGMLVRGPSCVNGKQIHFIDREAYLFIVRAGIAIYIGEGSRNRKHEEMLCGLFGLLEAGKVDPRLIILKIGERYCSHPEDRVLSILGLLGVNLESNEQLRTGKVLEEQIIEAAQKCHPDTLVLLFATDGAGSPTMGMSWAPNFRDSWESLICGWNDNSHCRVDREIKKQWIGGIQSFERKMEVLSVSAGGIKVACKKVNGYVRAICKDQEIINGAHVGSTDDAATHNLFCSKGKLIMSMEASTWMFDSVPSEKGETDHVKCRAIDGKFHIIYVVSTTDNHSRFSVTIASDMLPRYANKQATRGLAGLDVCMVLLGYIEEDGKDLIMVCLEDNKEQLHKIGILLVPLHQSNMVFGDKATKECMIGGFGRDLSKYLKLDSPCAPQGVAEYQEEHVDEDEERLYLACKGLLCPPMGGPPVPQHLHPELSKAVHDRMPIPVFQSTKHLLDLKHL